MENENTLTFIFTECLVLDSPAATGCTLSPQKELRARLSLVPEESKRQQHREEGCPSRPAGATSPVLMTVLRWEKGTLLWNQPWGHLSWQEESLCAKLSEDNSSARHITPSPENSLGRGADYPLWSP